MTRTWAGVLRRRRGAVVTVTLGLVLAAVVGLFGMPVQLLPEIVYPQIRVIADLPGQSAEDIEAALNQPLEEALADVQGVERLQSRAGDERSYVDLFFVRDHDLDFALQEVNAAVQRASGELPDTMQAPRIFQVSTHDEAAILVAVAALDRSSAELRRQVRSGLLPRLRGVDGVTAVHVSRASRNEMVIDVDQHALALSDWSASGFLGALRRQLEPPLSATLRDEEFEGLARYGRSRPSESWLRSLVLPAERGADLLVDDVAMVTRQPSEARLLSRLDGRGALLVEVMRAPGGRAHDVSTGVREAMDAWRADDEALEMVVLQDDAMLAEAALRGLLVAGLAGALLASLLLFLALRSARHLPSVVLILSGSMALALLVLQGLGLGLNLMTVAGLLFSIGLGLDYVIIFADRLAREASLEDAFAGVVGPLAGALLTTLAAVLPFLLVEGPVALLFAPMILSVVAASVACFVVAVCVLPAWGDGIRRYQERSDAGPADGEQGMVRAPTGPVPSRRSHRARAFSGLAAVPIALLAGWLAFESVPAELLPTVDDGLVRVRVNLPAGRGLADVDRIARRVEATLVDVPDTEHVHVTVGGYIREGAPSFRPGEMSFLVRVRRAPEGGGAVRWWNGASDALERPDIPHARIRHELPQIRGVRTSLADDDIVVVFAHEEEDLVVLRDVAQQVEREIARVAGLGPLQPSREGWSIRQIVEPDTLRMRDAQVSHAELRAAVEMAMEGARLMRWFEGGEPWELRTRFARQESGRSADLPNIALHSALGAPVRMGSVAEIRWIEEPLHIERDEGLRVMRMTASREGDAAPEEILAELREGLHGLDLPEGVSWRVEGELEAARDAMRSLLVALLLSILGVLAVVHLQYGTMVPALVTLLVLVTSSSGALVLTAVAGEPLSGLLLAGLLIAFGIVANGAILIFSEAWRDARDGQPDAAAMWEAARVRFRPIVLTVLTTSLGLAPLLFVGGGVSQLLRPLALAVTGALLVSIPLLRYTLPAVWSLRERLYRSRSSS